MQGPFPLNARNNNNDIGIEEQKTPTMSIHFACHMSQYARSHSEGHNLLIIFIKIPQKEKYLNCLYKYFIHKVV